MRSEVAPHTHTQKKINVWFSLKCPTGEGSQTVSVFSNSRELFFLFSRNTVGVGNQDKKLDFFFFFKLRREGAKINKQPAIYKIKPSKRATKNILI